MHFPWAPVRGLGDLRNRANSQWYSSIYEDRRPKIVEDIEKSDSKKHRIVLKDNKVLGTSMGNRAAEVPRPGHRVCCKILGREPGWAV